MWWCNLAVTVGTSRMRPDISQNVINFKDEWRNVIPSFWVSYSETLSQGWLFFYARIKHCFRGCSTAITILFTCSFSWKDWSNEPVYSSHIPVPRRSQQRGAKCASKHKNNNKIPVYFDNIILDGHKSLHVTSNRFRFLAALWEGFQTSFANNLLKCFLLRFVAVGPLCATVWRLRVERL